ncbi:MAG: ABC transporter permease [Nocardioidaceae bacterium]
MRSLSGTGTMIRLILRRDRIRLPVWVLAILVLVLSTANAVQSLYGTQHDRNVYADSIGSSPATVAMSGPPTALHSLGGVTVFEINATAIIAVILMVIFLLVRHTRTEEETGRSELVRSGRLGRHASLAAAVTVVGAASVIVGVVTAAGLVALGLPPAGAWVYGVALAMVGLVFLGITAVVVQVTEHARAAVGISASLLAVSFVVRAIGDVGNHAISWASPIGWSQAVYAFDANRWWPLAFSVVAFAALLVVAVRLGERRDLGAGLVPPQLGPAHASDRLSGAFGLSVRLQRTSVISWTAGMFLGGVAFGSVTRSIRSMLDEREDLAKVFSATGGNVVDGFLTSSALLLALIGCGFAISSTLRLRSEESAGRVETLLATPLPRWVWAAATLAVTFVGTLLILAASGLGLGLAYGVATGDYAKLPTLVGSTLVYTPAVLLVAGLAVLLMGWLPRLVMIAWAVLAVCVVVGYLGDLLELPAWLRQGSPFTHTPGIPSDAMSWAPVVVLALVAAALGWLGTTGLRKRDIATS